MYQDSPKDWQALCKAAATEADPKKLMNLVSEILEALDNNDRNCCGASAPSKRAEPRPVSDGCDGA